MRRGGTAGVIAASVIAIVVVLVALAAGRRSFSPQAAPAPPAPAESAGGSGPGEPLALPEASQGFLYGLVTTEGGAQYEGRVRWGGGEEAFWSDLFHGVRKENRWASYVPQERLPRESHPFRLLGFELFRRERPVGLGRPFVARFGDIARIERRGRDVLVTLRSGTVSVLDRYEAGDFDDGVRVWDERQGVVDLDSLQIRTIEFLPTPQLGGVPARLYGTVRTRWGDFTGFVQWDREKCVGSDELEGRNADGERLRLRFDSVRSIARRPPAGAEVTTLDGSTRMLSGTRDAGHGNRGLSVDDARYGRVLVSWDAFERVEFHAATSGPGYADFPQGQPLSGSVTTRDGRRWTGRLVYDLDESETTETLDAPGGGVDYMLPFGRVAAIDFPARGSGAPAPVRVTLHGGEVLELESSGDFGAGNAGMLLFVEGSERPEYLRPDEIARIELDRPLTIRAPAGDP
ncbi:MAG: hypothetical protein AB7G12_09480 [Thermoanaerobaculia bacterium]